jgi:hypothetical protein
MMLTLTTNYQNQKMLIDTNKLAKIQYHGEEGRTQPCSNAIIRLLQSGCQIEKVKLLTFGNSHCFLLSVEREGGYIAIKSGFRSGYSGESPRGLAHSLILLSNENQRRTRFKPYVSLQKTRRNHPKTYWA